MLAGLMIVGKTEMIQSALPYYRIDAVVRLDNTDRYDDRLEVFGNIIDGYDELMDFMAKHLPDPFYMEGDLRMSLRDKIFREVIANMLVHREYLNPTLSIIEITRDGIIAKNANRPLKAGNVTLDNYERHPKNPHMANFFVQIGRAEHLGTGIRNIYKYVPLYTGKLPVIDDENVYTVKMALPTLMNVESSGKQEGKVETTQKTTEKSTLKSTLKGTPKSIVELLSNNPLLTITQVAEILHMNRRGIVKHFNNLKSQGILRRVGPDKGGHWEVIDNQ